MLILCTRNMYVCVFVYVCGCVHVVVYLHICQSKYNSQILMMVIEYRLQTKSSSINNGTVMFRFIKFLSSNCKLKMFWIESSLIYFKFY